jgi:hypothetical protein
MKSGKLSGNYFFKGNKMARPRNHWDLATHNWWRRRESNPRPETFRQNIYIHSLYFKFAPQDSHRQDS